MSVETNKGPKVLQIVGYKNSGKTTLVEHLIKRFKDEGCTIGAVKHDAHDFETDHPGTDTWRQRKAGADIVAITSRHRTAYVSEKHTPLQELLQQMASMDLVLVEGFKQEPYPKIVVVKKKTDQALIDELDNVRGVVTWLPEEELNSGDIPVFSIHDTRALFQWMYQSCIQE